LKFLLFFLLLFACSNAPDVPDAPIETKTNDTAMLDRISQSHDELYVLYRVDAPILGKNDQQITIITKEPSSKILYEEAKKYELTSSGRFCLLGEQKICRDQDPSTEPDSTMLLFSKVQELMDMSLQNIEYRGLKNIESRQCHDFKLTADPDNLGNLKLTGPATIQVCFDLQTSVVLAATVSSKNVTVISWVIDEMSTEVDSSVYDSGILG